MTRGAQIEETEVRLLHLTEEQFDVRIYSPTMRGGVVRRRSRNGKTMLALEYARRSAMAGQRTLLVCATIVSWVDGVEGQSEGADYSNNLTCGKAIFKLLRRVILSSTIQQIWNRKRFMAKHQNFMKKSILYLV